MKGEQCLPFDYRLYDPGNAEDACLAYAHSLVSALSRALHLWGDKYIADRIKPPFVRNIARDVERASLSQRRRPAPIRDDHFPVREDW